MTEASASVSPLSLPHQPRSALSNRTLWWALLAAGCAVLLWPLLLVDMPPLLDYPNHLARAFILAQGDSDPLLAAMYAARWAIIPNLAMDAILPPLMHVLPVHVAGRLVIAFALLLPVAGGILYSRALFGRVSLWSLGICLATANGLFLLGFMNFQLSIGLALVCAAAWLRWRERYPAAIAAFAALATAALFLSHLMGLLFFGLLIGCSEVSRLSEVLRDRHLAMHAARRVLVLVPAAAVAVGLYSASSFGDEATQIAWGPLDQRLIRALPFFGYDLVADLACTALVLGALALLAWQRRLRVPRASVLLLGGLAGLALLAPLEFKGTGYVHARFAVMLSFMLFTAVRPVGLSRRQAWLLGVALAGIFLVRQVETAVVWHGHAQDLADLRRVTADMPPGSRVLTAAVDMDEAADGRFGFLGRQLLSDRTRIDGHVAALLVIERRAFWPFLFANLSQQPMRLREPFLTIGKQTVGIPNLRQLAASEPDEPEGGPFPIAGHWSCCYDYVLVVPAAAHPGFTDPELEPVARSDFADLFRVVPADSVASLR
jgi:hypothetical protein